jgi:hypothetical protein
MPLVAVTSIPSAHDHSVASYRALIWTYARYFAAQVRSDIPRNVAHQLAIDEHAHRIRIIYIAVNKDELRRDL